MPATGSRLHATQSTLRRSCFNTLDSLATRLYRGPLRAGTRCECTATCPQRSRRRAPGTSIMPICHSRVNHPQLARPVPHDKTARLRRLGSTAYESLMGDHIFPTPLFSTHCGFVFKATRGASPPGSPSRGYTRTGYTRRVALRLLRSHENRTTAFSPFGERVAIRQPTESRARGLSQLFSKQQEAKSVRCRPGVANILCDG